MFSLIFCTLLDASSRSDLILFASFSTMSISFDFSWYEDYRLTIRGGIQVIFYLLFVLAQIKILFGMFDIRMGGGGGSSLGVGGSSDVPNGSFSDSKGYSNYLRGGGH